MQSQSPVNSNNQEEQEERKIISQETFDAMNPDYEPSTAVKNLKKYVLGEVEVTAIPGAIIKQYSTSKDEEIDFKNALKNLSEPDRMYLRAFLADRKDRDGYLSGRAVSGKTVAYGVATVFLSPIIGIATGASICDDQITYQRKVKSRSMSICLDLDLLFPDDTILQPKPEWNIAYFLQKKSEKPSTTNENNSQPKNWQNLFGLLGHSTNAPKTDAPTYEPPQPN